MTPLTGVAETQTGVPQSRLLPSSAHPLRYIPENQNAAEVFGPTRHMDTDRLDQHHLRYTPVSDMKVHGKIVPQGYVLTYLLDVSRSQRLGSGDMCLELARSAPLSWALGT